MNTPRWQKLWGFAAALAVLAVVVILASRRGSSSSTIRVLHGANGRAALFLIADAKGFFTDEGLDIEFTVWRPNGPSPNEDWIALRPYEIVAGLPTPYLRAVLGENENEWDWFCPGFESVEGNPVSLVFVKRESAIDTLAALEEQIRDGRASLAVSSESWIEESRRLWEFPDGGGPELMKVFTPDSLSEQTAAVTVGDAGQVACLLNDPRFVRLEENVRARRLEDPYWDCGNLVRKVFATGRREQFARLGDALERARAYAEENPAEVASLLTGLQGTRIESGRMLGVPTFLSSAEASAAVAAWEASFNLGTTRLANHRPTDPVEAPSESLDRVTSVDEGAVPSFSEPKGKDVQLLLTQTD